MTLSIWRLSHLVIAGISSLFIVLASATGAILAFEPITQMANAPDFGNLDEITLSQSVSALKENYDEVLSIEIGDNGTVLASVFSSDTNGDIFINPKTGEKLGEPEEKAALFEFVTNLHRSLFLKSTGRFLVGLMSFFLVLMVITGLILLAKRQGGLKRMFAKVVYEDFNQFAHVVLSRYTFVLVLIVAISGVYLSLERFAVIPKSKVNHDYNVTEEIQLEKTPIADFQVFKDVKLSEVESLDFPFSNDASDFFLLKLEDRELLINQFNGEIVSNQAHSVAKLLSSWSFMLHTGAGSATWSIVLFFTCILLLFFIYSGLRIYLKRKKSTQKTVNSISAENAEYVILVGSETGNTYRSASKFLDALMQKGKRAMLSELNDYKLYPNAKHLVVFTATYGEGDAPTNAQQFIKRIDKYKQPNEIAYSVVGFGSLLYPDYCEFAILVDGLLQQKKNFRPQLPLFKINNQSKLAFNKWVRQWCNKNDIELQIDLRDNRKEIGKTVQFEVVDKTEINIDNTFILRLKPQQKAKFRSGDLLAIKPNENEAVRLYSIGKVEQDVVISVKRHENGICSNFLSNLNIGDTLSAGIRDNQDFQLPKRAKDVVMIANGTGIGPYLGMMNEKDKNLNLYWGGRKRQSVKLYESYINQALKKKNLKTSNIALSREESHNRYVQDLLLEDGEFISKHLKNEGIIMICGSISMQNGVLETLQTICKSRLNQPLSDYENNEQLLMDCY
ncbi:MAG: PepSY domain-containing protein [Bacteroidota bacterium]